MNNITNFEMSKLNNTLEIIAGSLEEIASSLSSIDDGIAAMSDSLENPLIVFNGKGGTE